MAVGHELFRSGVCDVLPRVFAGTSRKKARPDDQPMGVAIDMDTEEAALLGAMVVRTSVLMA